MTKVKQAELFADSARGIYIPQHFAESANRDKFKYIDKEQWGILESGPEADHYWDAWDEVLNSAETDCGGVLHQDGDLWIVWSQAAIDAVNDLCQSMLEHETSHEDSGDNYAHLVGESWCNQRTRDMVDELLREKFDSSEYAQGSDWINYRPQWEVLGIDKRWKDIQPDILADMALESFDMVPGSTWGPFPARIVLDSFVVSEIEVGLDHLDIDAITMDLIRESCDAYISGNDYAYIATDAVWYAVVNVEALNIEIEQYIDSMES
jgi:hypothetical protein